MNNQSTTKQRNVLITGGSRGIGRAVGLKLAEGHAANIILNYLENDKAAHETARMIEECGSRCIPVRANLMFPDEIDRMFDEIPGDITHLDVFVHCAALTTFKPLLTVKTNQWDLTMNVSARAFILCTQRIVPIMPSGGSIVAISSLGSRRVLPNYGAMGAAKAALEAAVRYFASELAPRGIRVNGVSSGFVETDSLGQFPQAKELRDKSIRQTPMGRLATPQDIASVIAFLCSSSARWICGQIVVADGGLSLQ